MRTVIFSTGPDIEAAHACRVHLGTLGVDAVVALDASSGGHLNAGEVLAASDGPWMGDEGAVGMAETLLAQAGGGPVARIDADTVFSADGIEWLAGAAGRTSRGYQIGYGNWCGAFSTTAEMLRRVLPTLRTARGNGCSGCVISFLLRKHGRFERASGVAHRWQEGRTIEPGCHLLTMPGGMPPLERAEALRRLWELTPLH